MVDRKESLKDLVKVADSENSEEFEENFPGSFEIEKMEEFKGAVIEGSKKNMQGIALVNYCKKIMSGERSGTAETGSSVKFIVSPCSENQSNMGDFDVLVMNIKFKLEEIVELIDGLLSSDVEAKLKTILGLFVKESDQQSVLNYIRTFL